MVSKNEFGKLVTAKMLELFKDNKCNDLSFSFYFYGAVQNRFGTAVDELYKEKVIRKADWQDYHTTFFIDILESDVGIHFDEKFLKKFYHNIKHLERNRILFDGRPLKNENDAVEQFKLHMLYDKIGKRMVQQILLLEKEEYAKKIYSIQKEFDGLLYLYTKAIDDAKEHGILTESQYKSFNDKKFFSNLMDDYCFIKTLSDRFFGYLFVKLSDKYGWKIHRHTQFILDYEESFDGQFHVLQTEKKFTFSSSI